MKNWILTVALVGAAALAACGGGAEKPQEDTGPKSLFDQAKGLSPEDSAVFAYQTFWAKKDTLGRECPAVLETIPRGVVPEGVAEDSIYHPYVGAEVFTLQCGEMRTGVARDPADHWLLVLKPGAADAEIVSCVQGHFDGCLGPPVVATPAPAAPASN